MGNQTTQQSGSKQSSVKKQPAFTHAAGTENNTSEYALPDVRKQAEELMLSAERDIQEYESDVSLQARQRAESSLESLRQALSEDDIEEIQRHMEKLSIALQRVGDETYEDVQQEAASTTMEQQGALENEPEDEERERTYKRKTFAAKLRKLADAIEKGEKFRIQVDGKKINVPVEAEYSIEYEKEEDEEEIEFQIKWSGK